MHRAWALVSMLSAPIATAAVVAVSLPAANNKNQYTSNSALPSDPIPKPSLTPQVLPGDAIALQSPNANTTLSIPLIDLTFTSLGRPLRFTTVFETVQLAVEQISLNVGLHPAKSITNGFFQQRNEGLVIGVHQYVGRQISWSLLNQLLLGLQNFTSQVKRSRELRFEIEVLDDGRVGYGSLSYIGPKGKDVAKRDENRRSQQLGIVDISEPALTNSTHSLLLPIPNEMNIVFSYHFFGPVIPQPAISACFTLARQSIHTYVQRRPRDAIPNGRFQFRAERSPISVDIEAFAGKEIMWHILDDILHGLSRGLIGQHRLQSCEFEFEVFPFEEPLGHGSLRYDTEADFGVISSEVAASAVKRPSPRLRARN